MGGSDPELLLWASWQREPRLLPRTSEQGWSPCRWSPGRVWYSKCLTPVSGWLSNGRPCAGVLVDDVARNLVVLSVALMRVTGEDACLELRMTVDTEDRTTEDRAFRETFEAFYQREVRSVVGLAYVLSGSGMAAEDLAQEGFIAALRHWDRIGHYDDPGAWVRRVVSNRSVSRFRRLAAEGRARMRLGELDYTIPEVDVDAVHIWDEVRRLPARQAQVIALCYYDRCSIADTARILECSETTVKTHLRRARQTLERRLREETAR